MKSLAWPGVENGRIDTALLVDISGREDYLRTDAAKQWGLLAAACQKATGTLLKPASGSSCYRPYAIQEAFYEAYIAYLNGGPAAAVAAVPGTSNHGWAMAIDIAGYENDPKVWQWLLNHAHEYGYDWTTGKASGEQWHWEYWGSPTITTAAVAATIIEGDDMPNLTKTSYTDAAIDFPKGEFRHLPVLTRAATYDISRGPEVGILTVNLAPDAVPVGQPVQVRACRYQGGKRVESFDAVEITGTSGSTYGQYVCEYELAAGDSIRTELCVFDDGIKVTRINNSRLRWN